MLFLIMGASGAGKSSVLAGLQQQRPAIDWRDFDHTPTLATSTAERQRNTEYWLQVALENQSRGISTGIAGTVVLGEVLACASAPAPEGIAALLLDCADVLRIDRIRSRDGADAAQASQDMLCWAAWLRMHASDPQWRQDVIQTHGAPGMRWERWSSWRKGDPRWQTEVLDNSSLSVADTTNALQRWVNRRIGRLLP